MRVDFTPVVYEHAAAFLGKTPWEVSRSRELLVQAHRSAWEYYRHSPITVGIDIYNLEAEAYGAQVEDPKGPGVPAIKEHIAYSVEDIRRLQFFDPEKDGRFPDTFAAAEELKRLLPGTDVRIPMSGPFSLASNLIDLENLLMETYSDPRTVLRALLHLVEGQLKLAQAIKKRNLDVTFFESAATPPLVSPEMFREVEFPALKALMDGTAEIFGHRIACVLGGDTTPILDYLLACNPSLLIDPAETDQKAFLERMKDRPDVLVRINMVAEKIVRGTDKGVRSEARRVYLLGKDRDPVLISTGVLPYETQPERIRMIQDYLEHLTV